MANTLVDNIIKMDTTGAIKELNKNAADPIRVRLFVFTSSNGAGGQIVIADGQSASNEVLTLEVPAKGSVPVTYGTRGMVFPHGLQVVSISGSCKLYVHI
jgi:hypothetical protein